MEGNVYTNPPPRYPAKVMTPIVLRENERLRLSFADSEGDRAEGKFFIEAHCLSDINIQHLLISRTQ